MLSFKIYSLFPEIFPGSLQHGLIGKAYKNKVWDFQTIQIRDYSNYSGNSVDDKPFSGGAGMVLRPDVISDAIEKTTSKEELNNTSIVQKKLLEYSVDLIVLSGFLLKVPENIVSLFPNKIGKPIPSS